MKYISSRKNARYKSLVKLQKKKYRDERGLYIIEGVKPLKDALESGCPVKEIYIREGTGENVELPAEGDSAAFLLEGGLFDRISDTRTSQGVLAVAAKNLLSGEDFIKLMNADGNSEGNFLILDRLQDPGNVGTIIRTAEAAGYKGAVLVSGTADPYSPKAARAAAGSLFRIPLTEAASDEEVAELAEASGRKLAVSCLQGAVSCFETDLSSRTALVIGNEGSGASPGLIDKARIRVRIPMEGRIESLNAAVAAGILMYRRMEYTGNER